MNGGPSAPSHARTLVNASGRPGPTEQIRLAAELGPLLRSLRDGRGLSLRALAARAAVSPGALAMLEAGQRRPRAALLGALAYGLAPEDPKPVLALLAAAAGPSLRQDTPGSLRRRRRRMLEGVRTGAVELPPSVRDRLEAHRAADDAYAAAMALTRHPAAGERQVREGRRLLDEARRLRERAGPPVVVEVGGARIVHGWRFP